MLETLSIKNIAVIDSAEIHFQKGLNILSGETGAGKSIVIEAISLLLGGRASTELIRAGCDEAVVEGLFDTTDLAWIRERLNKLGFSTGPSKSSRELLIKRTVHRSGRHRIFVNGELATVGILQELCEGLVDLCGQHEHQSLTKPATQLDLLDRYGGLVAQTQAYSSAFDKCRALEQESIELHSAEAERTRRSDFLRFQIEELRAADLVAGEEDCLQTDKSLLQSAEGRAQHAHDALEILESSQSQESSGTLETLRTALAKSRSLTLMDPRALPIQETMERALAETEEASLALYRYIGLIDLNPEKLAQVQERLSLLADLRRKYGAHSTEMLTTLTRLEEEFEHLGESEKRIAAVEAELHEAQSELSNLGKKLSQSRKKVAELLGASVTSELKDLKMGEAQLQIELTLRESLAEWTASGADQIQFVVRTNVGEPARPLGKIASGGELSRLMLSVRRVISDKGGIGVYLFDEIDAGIGGQTAFQVGKKLKSVASFNQVICITHLPQVASFADHHWAVRKISHGKRTLTEVVSLTARERKEEVARMLGGPDLTRKSLENAGELLELAR